MVVAGVAAVLVCCLFMNGNEFLVDGWLIETVIDDQSWVGP